MLFNEKNWFFKQNFLKTHKSQSHLKPQNWPNIRSNLRQKQKLRNCENFIKTSALTQHNLKEVFDKAIMASLKGRKIKEKQAAKKVPRDQGWNCAIL